MLIHSVENFMRFPVVKRFENRLRLYKVRADYSALFMWTRRSNKKDHYKFVLNMDAKLIRLARL